RGFMVIGEKHPRVVVALLHMLFPHAMVVTKRQGRVTLPVDIGPSVDRVLQNILDRMIGWQLPYPLDLAMERLVHRELDTLFVEPLKHLPDAPECAKLGKDQRDRFLHAHIAQVQGAVAVRGDFCSGGVQAYTDRATFAMMAPLRSFAEGVPHGHCYSSDQSRGPLAFGAGGGPQAQHRCAHRYLLPAAPRPCALVWPWSRSPAPGDSRWPSCPL